jgi:hypothetical protein
MPKEFFYHQEEGEFKRNQNYIFKNSKIYVKEIHYVKLTDKVRKEEEKIYPFDGYPDPYTASLVLYESSIQNGAGVIRMFYDGKKYHIPYKVVREEGIEVPAGNYYAKVVDVSPNVETKGLLQPKGSWKLWIEKYNLFPVRMQLFFVLGSVRAVLEEVKGDKDLLRKVLLGRG